MKSLFALAVSLTLLCGAADLTTAEEAVSLFPDTNLETAVRRYVFEKRNNQEPITAEDVVNISTISVDGISKPADQRIKDLSGLEN